MKSDVSKLLVGIGAMGLVSAGASAQEVDLFINLTDDSAECSVVAGDLNTTVPATNFDLVREIDGDTETVDAGIRAKKVPVEDLFAPEAEIPNRATVVQDDQCSIVVEELVNGETTITTYIGTGVAVASGGGTNSNPNNKNAGTKNLNCSCENATEEVVEPSLN